MNYEKIMKSLKNNGYKVSYYETQEQASKYLVNNIKAYTIGFGDSQTLAKMKLAELLVKKNVVIDPSTYSGVEFYDIARKTLLTDIVLTSVNAAAETGELVNIDGAGNRVAGSLFGHQKVYFIFGKNKIEATLEKAIWRARNIAGPQNAKRLGCKTPCVIKGDRCYDCSSPDRICNSLNIHLKKMEGVEAEIIMINQSLGI